MDRTDAATGLVVLVSVVVAATSTGTAQVVASAAAFVAALAGVLHAVRMRKPS